LNSMTIDKNKKVQGLNKNSRKKNLDFSIRKEWFSVNSPKEFG
jgi:ribosomal protein S3AE